MCGILYTAAQLLVLQLLLYENLVVPLIILRIIVVVPLTLFVHAFESEPPSCFYPAEGAEVKTVVLIQSNHFEHPVAAER